MALVPSQSADSVTHSRSGRGEDMDGHPPRSLPPKEDYLAYTEMVEKSEGFDVDHFPTLAHMLNIIHPIQKAELKDFTEMLEYSTELAVKAYQEEHNEPLEVVKIVKANYIVRDPYTFYITFKAKDPSASKAKKYQAKVSYCNPKEASQVRLVRLQPHLAGGDGSSKHIFTLPIKKMLHGSLTGSSKTHHKKKHSEEL